MSEAMTQEDAMKMDNRQAAEILKPLRDMMIDQNGCPVSSAVFALDKAIEALTADVRENVRGEWIEKYYESNETGETVFHGMIMCSACGHIPKVGWLSNFCPNCGADMRGDKQ